MEGVGLKKDAKFKTHDIFPEKRRLQRDYVYRQFEEKPVLPGMEEDTPYDFDHICPQNHWYGWTGAGEGRKSFTFEQNQRSRSIRITVHVRPEWVFTLPQNMHTFILGLQLPATWLEKTEYRTGL